MAYDEILAERVSQALGRTPKVTVKKMMGGLCYMVDGKMALGLLKDDLMVRLDHAVYGESLARKGARVMDLTGKPMKGYVFVGPAGTKSPKDLKHWVDLALDFNKRAKPSKKKAKRKV